MSIFATKLLFYTHGFVAILIMALIFTLVGYLIGRGLWGRRRTMANRMEALNETLKKKKETLAGDQEKLSALLKDFADSNS